MRSIDLMYTTMLAELGQRVLDDEFTTDFPTAGRFVTVTVKGRDYWYFDLPTAGRDKRTYVGPASDPEITARVNAHNIVKDDLRARRRLVASLKREGGMTAPDKLTGDITQALGAAGLFRLRAIIVGTVAFQSYSGILGVRLPAASMMTGDVDYAQDYAISAEVGDSLPPILDLLQGVDPSFRAVPHQADKAKVTAFVNGSGYRVEFLTGNRGSDDYTGKPSAMPALGGASAENLRFMDYLLVDAIRTVMLHNSGFTIIVPSPERYAIHKLIVASRRRTSDGTLKREKDALQASLLFEGMEQTRRHEDVKYAYEEAWERGTAWQEAILSGIGLMNDKGRKALARLLDIELDNPALFEALKAAIEK